MTKWRNIIIYLAFGGIMLFAWLKLVDIPDLVSSLKDIAILPIVAAAALYLVAYFLRSLRWKLIIDPISNVSIPFAFCASMASMLVNYALSFRAGDLAQCVIMKRSRGTPISTSLSTVFIDRLMNLSPIIPVLIFIPLVSFDLDLRLAALLAFLLILFTAFLGLLIIAVRDKQRVISFSERLLFVIPRRFRQRIVAFLDSFVEGIKLARINSRRLVLILLLTALATGCEGSYFYMMFRAFGESTSFATVLFGYTILNIAFVIPMPPGQLGAMELLVMLIFTYGLGIDRGVINPVILSAHLLTGLLIFLVGLAAFAFLGIRVRDAVSPES